jgi:hypothetical protein
MLHNKILMRTKLKHAIILHCGVLNSGFKIFLAQVSGFQTVNCNFRIDLAIKVCGFHLPYFAKCFNTLSVRQPLWLYASYLPSDFDHFHLVKRALPGLPLLQKFPGSIN